jgi:phospholipid/cholesterol/gamma-HCH transport system substrate-binding protein
LNELKVGLVTLAAIFSTVFISLKITSNQSGFGTYYTYRSIVGDASGIYPKTPIKVAGINSGNILKIELQGTKALITFEVIEEVKVTQNSVLRIKTVGFLGDKYLDIFLGEPMEERLPEDSMVPSKTGGGIEDVTKDVSDVMTEVKDILKKVKEGLEDDQKRNVIKKIAKNIETATENIKDLSQTLKNNDGNIDKMLKNFKKISEQLAYETDRMEEGSSMSQIAPMMADARKAVQDLKHIVEDVKAGKGTVGKLLRDDEVVDQVSETLSGVNRLVNRINNIEAEINMYSGVNTKGGSETRFDVDIYPGPERFFRLGIIDNDFGPEVANDKTTTVNNGAPTNTREVDNEAIKFNAQIGRKIHRWSFRAGLIETAGGLGVDYALPNQGMKFSMEVFDYRDDIGPNVRLISEFRLYSVLYMRLAGEDMANDLSGTISFGLKFSDQDLASLIGLVAN